MTEEHNRGLSLSALSCRCSLTSADEVARPVTRVMIVLPGLCHNSRRDDILAELNDILAGPGYRAQAFELDDARSGGKFLDGFSAVGGLVVYVSYLRTLIRRLNDFDVLHLVYHPGASFVSEILSAVMLAKFFGRKVVLDYRTPIIFSPRAGERFLVERMWRLCDRVLVQSVYQQQLVSSFGGKASYIRAGVDLERVKARVVKNVQPRILVAADLEKEHNIATAIRAFTLVKQKYPRTEMTIIGVGSEESALKDMVSRDRIHGITFAGAVTGHHRTTMIERFDLYLNCSSVDYVTTATVEAFAGGLPVLTTPLSGGGDVLRSRENIILLPYNDQVGTAERIIELVENPELAEKLSLGSRRTGEGYSHCQRKAEWARLYRNLSRGIN